MDEKTLIALSAAAGAVIGSGISAAAGYLVQRANLRQRQREQLVERAYDAATAEYKSGLEAMLKHNPENGFVVAEFPRYLIFHLTLIDRLIDRDAIKRLDEESVTHALDDAARLARAPRKDYGLAGEEARK